MEGGAPHCGGQRQLRAIAAASQWPGSTPAAPAREGIRMPGPRRGSGGGMTTIPLREGRRGCWRCAAKLVSS
eukprot:12686803-Prorocentrum_lima.AAC.1